MKTDQRTTGIFTGAALLRLFVFAVFPKFTDFLTTQVEISTPVSSFKRLQEGLFLYERGLSPYDGGLFHQAPLLLVIFQTIPAPVIFVALDLLNAYSLMEISEQLEFNSPRFVRLDGFAVAASYLFNPFTILSCLGRSTSIFTNSAIIQAVLDACSGNALRAMFALAIGTYLSMYPLLLLPPILLLINKRQRSKDHQIKSTVYHISFYLLAVAMLLGASAVLTSDIWEFLSSCYGFQIAVPDLTPNIGLWWYFFIEIFDAFRDFFIGVFWLHMAAYVGGFTFRLQNQPLFVVYSLLGLLAIFKPYPSISDISLYLGFMPLYQHIVPLTRYTFIAASVLLYSTLLGPAFHYLWIYAGSGNANFFYAITLVWSLGLSILVGDSLFAVLRDEWEIERPEMKGKDVRRI